jgi:hypothetical protein
MAFYINLGWAIISTFISVSTTFKHFEIEFMGEEYYWGIGTLGVMFLLFALSAVIYGDFLPSSVFMFYCFGLYVKFSQMNDKEGIFIFLFIFR